MLGSCHLMAESPNGVAIQIYSALMAALMLQLLIGKHPGKRAMEMLRFHMMGLADLDGRGPRAQGGAGVKSGVCGSGYDSDGKVKEHGRWEWQGRDGLATA